MRRLDLSRFIFLCLFLIPAVVVAQEDCRLLTEAKKLPGLTTLLDSGGVVANLPADSSGPAEVLVSAHGQTVNSHCPISPPH